MFCTFSLPNVLRATTACTLLTSQLPNVVRTSRVLTLFTSKCAPRHNDVHFYHIELLSNRTFTYTFASGRNGVHFVNISTSKRRPNLTCFDIFYFTNVLLATTACTSTTSNRHRIAFSLTNVLRAATACTFSTSQLPKAVRG